MIQCDAIPATIPRIGNVCSFCLDEFEDQETGWTHLDENGVEVNHDHFHKECLIRWVKINPTCPYEQTPINPDSLISRTERIFDKAKQFLVNSACAMSLGGVVTAVAVAAVAVAGGVAGEEVVPVNIRVIVVGVAGLAVATGDGRSVAVGMVPAGGVAKVMNLAEMTVATVAAVTAFELGAIGVAQIGIWILTHLEISQNDQTTIGCGLLIGSVVAHIITDSAALNFLVITSLAAGIFSGAATLIRP